MPTISDDAHCENGLNDLLELAYQFRASDIHIEPRKRRWQIRMRIDGILHKISNLPFEDELLPRISARIKVLSSLDIGESRLPQDGQFKPINKNIEIRVSTLAIKEGEKTVLRIFNEHNGSLRLEELGLSQSQLKTIQNFELLKEGIVLVVGPTGSGKTTTLYAIIDYLNNEGTNTVSVEDPIERAIDDINQVEVNTKAGRTFATVLRAFLRQDPDIIFIGEIRDEESAQIALRAAQTGHLVLASVHANDIENTYHRLAHLGIDSFEAQNSVRYIINQRLVRLICTECNGDYVDCSHCNNGFSGRRALIEIGNNNNPANPTIDECGHDLIRRKLTTKSEVIRALGI